MIDATQKQVMAWWTRHNKLRRGTKKRQASKLSAERKFGTRYVDGFLHGLNLWLVLVPMGDEFNQGYWAGQEYRWQRKRAKQRRNAR